MRYFDDKQIYRTLEKQGIKRKKVRAAIDSLDFQCPVIKPRTCVVGIDTTYTAKDFGATIFRDITNNTSLHWAFVEKENISTHIHGVNAIKKAKIEILGFVVDGFFSFFVHYSSQYPIQMCQKHMKDIVKRYITNRPILPAAIELKEIMKDLTKMSSKEFDYRFGHWKERWKEFLKERTYYENGKWEYTHRRLRSAVASLIRYRPYLFTFEKYRWLPRTNNKMEGFNSGLKSYLSIHRGLRGDRLAKLMHRYLVKDSKYLE